MKTKLALLFYRVARWLWPELFKQSVYLTLNELYVRRAHLEMAIKGARSGLHHDLLAQQLYVVKIMIDATILHRAPKYEEVKVEIRYDEAELNKATGAAFRARTDKKLDRSHFIKEEAKKRLFSALAVALAQSREIDLHLYFREVNKGVVTMGVRMYVKHQGYDSGPRSQVGNYESKIKGL